MPAFRRFLSASLLTASALVLTCAPAAAETAPSKTEIPATMKRATRFMVESASTNGGYVWSYLPDMSRRWGEMEATPDDDLGAAAGHGDDGPSVPRRLSRDRRRLLLPRPRTKAADALIAGQLPHRRLELFHRFRRAEASTRRLVRRRSAATPGGSRNSSIIGATPRSTMPAPRRRCKLLLRLYVEKRDAKYRAGRSTRRSTSSSTANIRSAAGRSAIRCARIRHHGQADYTSFITFNDDVAAENIRLPDHGLPGARRCRGCCDPIVAR